MLTFLKSILVALSILTLISAATAQDNPPVCLSGENSHTIDFWLGSWRVTDTAGKTEFGTNRVERALKGCAIFENWISARGGQGKSLFYYDARDDSWTQVWVTENTAQPGGLKIKHLMSVADNGSVTFQGTLMTSKGGTYLDRTTLTPNSDGTVRQLIEVSLDDGANWQTTFDAIYHPATD